MPLILRALGDPAAERFLLRRREVLVRGLRRHDVVLVRGEDALDDLRLVGLAGHDGDLAGFGRLERLGAEVDAEAALARLGVEAVAVKARVRHDRPDVAVEIHLCRSARGVVGNHETKNRNEAGEDAHGRLKSRGYLKPAAMGYSWHAQAPIAMLNGTGGYAKSALRSTRRKFAVQSA